ncbi:hypothetical protein DPMN_133045 [Dreissena polymorpha]|uniref:THD domain-containing protein n=1 Tax=Dreissena polymorpha TaxID=45954 RepID=A0A9D4J9E8_DREPO|nr:hypothetical protein DPMN_133045 [Dreissena polymorpha]
MHSSAHPEMDSTVSKCLNIQKDMHACRDLIIGMEGVKSESLHRRLCSRFARVFWCRSVVISMLLVSFISHLLLHVQLGEVREVVRVQRDRIEDLMEVSHILLNEDTSFKTRSKLESQDQIQRSGTSRRARQKRHVPASPNFFFRGRSGVNPSTRDLLWVKELCDDETFHPEWSGSFVKSVMIMKPGIYFVFAKIGVNGLANHSTYAPGLMLMKTHRRHGTNITLETAYLTQDNRGLPYTHQNNRPYSPLDTLPISGLFRLRKNEKLFVKVRDHPMGALYDLDGNHTHFGAFMVQTKDS